MLFPVRVIALRFLPVLGILRRSFAIRGGFVRYFFRGKFRIGLRCGFGGVVGRGFGRLRLFFVAFCHCFLLARFARTALRIMLKMLIPTPTTIKK